MFLALVSFEVFRGVQIRPECAAYAFIAALHIWWALQSYDAEDRRDHLVDAALHAALAAAHMS